MIVSLCGDLAKPWTRTEKMREGLLQRLKTTVSFREVGPIDSQLEPGGTQREPPGASAAANDTGRMNAEVPAPQPLLACVLESSVSDAKNASHAASSHRQQDRAVSASHAACGLASRRNTDPRT